MTTVQTAPSPSALTRRMARARLEARALRSRVGRLSAGPIDLTLLPAVQSLLSSSTCTIFFFNREVTVRVLDSGSDGGLKMFPEVVAADVVVRDDPGEVDKLVHGGVSDIRFAEAREHSVALPVIGWRPRIWGRRLVAYRERDKGTLADLDAVEIADDFRAIWVAITRGLSYLHSAEVAHANLSQRSIVLALADSRWLVADPLPTPLVNSGQSDRQRDVAMMFDVVRGTICDPAISAVPVVRQDIADRWDTAKVQFVESLIGWGDYSAKSQAPDSVLSATLAAAEIIDSENDTRARYLQTLMSDVLAARSRPLQFDKGLASRYVINIEDMDRVSTHDDEAVRAQISKDVDGAWQRELHADISRRLAKVATARDLLAKGREPDLESLVGRGAGDALDGLRTGRVDLREVLAWSRAEMVVAAYERSVSSAGVAVTDAYDVLMQHALEHARLKRKMLLEGGFVRSHVLQEVLASSEVELYAMMRTGQLVAVIDHNELLFPKFQLISAEVFRLVGEVGQGRFVYPSWSSALWWFAPLNARVEESPADLVLRGDVAFAASGVRRWLAVAHSDGGDD